MNLINDLDTDLALAFLVEQRFRQKVDSKEALALITRVRLLLESTSKDAAGNKNISSTEKAQIVSTH